MERIRGRVPIKEYCDYPIDGAIGKWVGIQNRRDFTGGADKHTDLLAGAGCEPLLKRCLDALLVELGDKHDVARSDVGPDASKSCVLPLCSKIAHRELAGTAYRDGSQNGNMGPGICHGLLSPGSEYVGSQSCVRFQHT